MPQSTVLISDGNVFSHGIGAPFITSSNLGNHISLAHWQSATGQDSRSQLLDVKPYWTASHDLHLSEMPPQLLPGIVDDQTTPVIDDIDGEVRNASVPIRGADELPIDLAVVMSSGSNVHTNENTQLVFNVGNNGPGNVYGATLTVLIPTGFVVSNTTSDAGSGIVDNGKVKFLFPIIDEGTTVTAVLNGYFNIVHPAQVVATVESLQTDVILENNSYVGTLSISRGLGPDLSGIWLSADVKSRNRLFAEFLIFNNGTADVKQKSELLFKVSNDSLGPGMPVRAIKLGKLKHGNFHRVKLRLKKVAVPSPYLFQAFLDADNTVPESDEGNNLIETNFVPLAP